MAALESLVVGVSANAAYASIRRMAALVRPTQSDAKRFVNRCAGYVDALVDEQLAFEALGKPDVRVALLMCDLSWKDIIVFEFVAPGTKVGSTESVATQLSEAFRAVSATTDELVGAHIVETVHGLQGAVTVQLEDFDERQAKLLDGQRAIYDAVTNVDWVGDPPCDYGLQLRDVWARHSKCRERGNDLKRVRSLVAQTNNRNVLLTGEAWSGKSNLLAHITRSWKRMNGRPLTIVSFFVQGQLRQDSAEDFLYAINSQLIRYLGLPAGVPQERRRMEAQLRELWIRAERLAEESEEELLLLVDGIDEEAAPSEISALVPESSSVAVSTLLGVRAGYRFDKRTTRTEKTHLLKANQFSADMPQDLDSELQQALMGHPGAARVLAAIHVVAAPISVREIAYVTRLAVYEVEAVLTTTLRHLAEVGRGKPRYVLCHVEVFRSLGSLLESELMDMRRAFIEWAEQLRDAGWPAAETPGIFSRALGTIIRESFAVDEAADWLSVRRFYGALGDPLSAQASSNELRYLHEAANSMKTASDAAPILARVSVANAALASAAIHLDARSWADLSAVAGIPFAYSLWLLGGRRSLTSLLSIARGAPDDWNHLLIGQASSLIQLDESPWQARLRCLLALNPTTDSQVENRGAAILMANIRAVQDYELQDQLLDIGAEAASRQVPIGLLLSARHDRILFLEEEAVLPTEAAKVALVAARGGMSDEARVLAAEVLDEEERCIEEMAELAQEPELRDVSVASYLENLETVWPFLRERERLGLAVERLSDMSSPRWLAPALRHAARIVCHEVETGETDCGELLEVIDSLVGTTWDNLADELGAALSIARARGTKEATEAVMDSCLAVFLGEANHRFDSPDLRVGLARAAHYLGSSSTGLLLENALDRVEESYTAERGSFFAAKLLARLLPVIDVHGTEDQSVGCLQMINGVRGEGLVFDLKLGSELVNYYWGRGEHGRAERLLDELSELHEQTLVDPAYVRAEISWAEAAVGRISHADLLKESDERSGWVDALAVIDLQSAIGAVARIGSMRERVAATVRSVDRGFSQDVDFAIRTLTSLPQPLPTWAVGIVVERSLASLDEQALEDFEGFLASASI